MTAIPKLLQLLDLAGSPVTIDAMECQQESAQVITDKEADYVLALKKNHGTLYEDVWVFFIASALPMPYGSIGALRTRCIGCWMSPLMRMPVAFGKIRERRRFRCYAILH